MDWRHVFVIAVAATPNTTAQKLMFPLNILAPLTWDIGPVFSTTFHFFKILSRIEKQMEIGSKNQSNQIIK